MKKFFFLSLMIAVAAMFASAQTNFRHISFDEAAKIAQQENKLIFIDFFAEWCGPCKKMSAEVFPQQSVGEFMNKNFVCLKMDAEKEGAELARKYKVAAYPTYVIVKPDGELAATFSGYMEGSKFIGEIKKSLDPEQTPERLKARYESGERTPELVNAYTMEIMKSGDEEKGFKVIDDYFASLSDAQKLLPENTFIYTVYTVAGDNDRYEYMFNNYDRFPASEQPAIRRQLRRILNTQFSQYFSGFKFREGKYDQAEFDHLVSRLAKIGYADDYKVPCEFIAARVAAKDDAEYMKYCEDNFDRLSEGDKSMIIFNLTRLVAPSPELTPRLSHFLRSRLEKMSAVAIQFAGRTLGSIEGN